MRATVVLDDSLIAKAQVMTGLRESARRLAKLGGSEPDLRPIPRRPDPA